MSYRVKVHRSKEMTVAIQNWALCMKKRKFLKLITEKRRFSLIGYSQ